MRTLTAIWFKVSDLLAWLLVAFSLLASVAYPVVIPIYQRMTHQPLSALAVAGTSALWLAVAAGALAVTRRRVAGVALITLPALPLLVSGEYLVGLVAALGLGLAFATPFLLAFTQARASSHARQAA